MKNRFIKSLIAFYDAAADTMREAQQRGLDIYKQNPDLKKGSIVELELEVIGKPATERDGTYRFPPRVCWCLPALKGACAKCTIIGTPCGLKKGAH